jgi:HK97 family phage major capsid protein
VDLHTMLAQARAVLDVKLGERKTAQDALMALRGRAESSGDVTLEETEAAIGRRSAADAAVDAARATVSDLQGEVDRDAEIEQLSTQVSSTGQRPAYDRAVRTGAEPRTYTRQSDPKGEKFLADFLRGTLSNDFLARGRIERHMAEEQAERGEMLERAIGTGAFSGLTVPQYLVEEFAEIAKAGRPFADVCRPHDLPATGMSVEIGRGTTGTNVDVQATEGAAAAEQDYDDTLLSVPVRTAAGQQTISQQGMRRSIGAHDITVEDLLAEYHTDLDQKLITQATTGLSAVATSVAYTDATPTVEELYPKFAASSAGVSAALLNKMRARDLVHVMHSRRWFWMNSALSPNRPLIGQPGIDPNNVATNYAEVYGAGFAGLLPNGQPVVLDDNIAINLGAGTNEDEIYTVARSECHLWEDPAAPLFIETDATKAANLQVLIVVFGFYAYTFGRRPHARKIAGTGLITPVF